MANISLFLNCRPTTNCDGYFQCMKADGWHWIGGGSTKKLDIDPSHQAAVGGFKVDELSKCVKLVKSGYKLEDVPCSNSIVRICTLSYGGAGLGASIGILLKNFLRKSNQLLIFYFLVVPKYVSGTITCTDPPTPPSEAKMALSDTEDQPVIMCPNKKAKYDCAAGGIDVRFVC